MAKRFLFYFSVEFDGYTENPILRSRRGKNLKVTLFLDTVTWIRVVNPDILLHVQDNMNSIVGRTALGIDWMIAVSAIEDEVVARDSTDKVLVGIRPIRQAWPNPSLNMVHVHVSQIVWLLSLLEFTQRRALWSRNSDRVRHGIATKENHSLARVC